MKIKHLAIKNFRNIKEVEYDLTDRNVFIGPNYLGKTNTILAIYWLLTGYLMDGSSDDASNKPNMSDDEKKQTVSVELTFEDGWTIRKEYKENWVKKRGSREIVLEGNITQYFAGMETLDKCSVKEAEQDLLKRIGYNRKLETSKFNLVTAMIDPYYVASRCDWKVVRSFIIELIGDVSNDDVYATNEILLPIKPLLTQYEHDLSKVMKHLKSRISNVVSQIDTKDKSIQGFNAVEDVDADDLLNAEAMIEQLDTSIANYKQQLINSVNPNIQKLENKRAGLQLKLSEQLSLDKTKLDELNVSANSKIKDIQSQLDAINDNKRSLLSKITMLEQEKIEHEAELSKMNREVEAKMATLMKGREEYKAIASDEFTGEIKLPEASSCPHCGGLLNEDVLNAVKEQNQSNRAAFEVKKQERLQANIDAGKALKLTIDNFRFKIDDFKAQGTNFDTAILQSEIASLEKKKVELEANKNEVQLLILTDYVSDETKQLRRDLNTVEVSLLEEKKVDTTTDINLRIKECSDRKAPYVDTINKHGFYKESLKHIEAINQEIASLTDIQCGYENELALVERFMKTKLSMLEGNVEKVFGTRVSFKLIETNIKEGSWSEVCYPLAIDENTPCKELLASESKRVITGVYIIECIKQAMSLPDLPIIFDAGSEMDSKSFSERLETKAQIITTKVDDIHYDKITLIGV